MRTLPSISFVLSRTDINGEAMSLFDTLFCGYLPSLDSAALFLSVSTFNSLEALSSLMALSFDLGVFSSSFGLGLTDFFFSFFDALAYADYLRAGSTTLI